MKFIKICKIPFKACDKADVVLSEMDLKGIADNYAVKESHKNTGTVWCAKDQFYFNSPLLSTMYA